MEQGDFSSGALLLVPGKRMMRDKQKSKLKLTLNIRYELCIQYMRFEKFIMGYIQAECVHVFRIISLLEAISLGLVRLCMYQGVISFIEAVS